MLRRKLLLIIIATTNIIIQPAQSFILLKMTWKDTWSDIQNGGSKRWKVDEDPQKCSTGVVYAVQSCWRAEFEDAAKEDPDNQRELLLQRQDL